MAYKSNVYCHFMLNCKSCPFEPVSVLLTNGQTLLKFYPSISVPLLDDRLIIGMTSNLNMNFLYDKIKSNDWRCECDGHDLETISHNDPGNAVTVICDDEGIDEM